MDSFKYQKNPFNNELTPSVMIFCNETLFVLSGNIKGGEKSLSAMYFPIVTIYWMIELPGIVLTCFGFLRYPGVGRGISAFCTTH